MRRVRSSTAVGISVVWVEFDWGTDIYKARQVVAERLNLIAGTLPPEVERPILAPISSIMGEVLFLALTSDRHSGIELRTAADTTIRRRLLSVPGVAQVIPIGGGVKQYQVVLSPARLRAYGLSLSEVADRLGRTNRNVSAGLLVEGGQERLIHGVGRVRDLADIAETVVAVRDGVPVTVGQLGDVRIGEAIKRGEGSSRARPAVVLGVQKQPQVNTLALTRTLDATLDEIEATLPEGMTIDRHVFRQADFIARAVRNVEVALRDGGILVVVVVLVFLANLRASLITLLAIPLSLVTAVLVLSGLGATINTMTLGGMAIAIGELVDDAIIDVENVFRRLRENHHLPPERRRSPIRVVYEASVEIRSSVVFATLIILLVFLPLFALSGVEGRLLRPLGVAYIVSLLASLAVALTLTPALCSLLLPRSRAVLHEREPLVVRLCKRLYRPVLRRTLRHPWLIASACVILLVGTAATVPSLGRAFLPEFNEGALVISAVTLPGTSLAESDALGRAVERTILAHPEVSGIARRTGRAELDEHAQGVEAAEIDVTYRLPPGRSKDDFLADLRRDLSTVPGMNITIGQPIAHRIDHMLSGSRSNVAVKIFGDDLYKLRNLGEQVRRVMAEVPGVVDLATEPQVDIPLVEITLDRPAIARHGLTVEEVTQTSRRRSWAGRSRRSWRADTPSTSCSGWATRRRPTGRRCATCRRYAAGAQVPLRALARIGPSTGPNQISREDVDASSSSPATSPAATCTASSRTSADASPSGCRSARAPYRGYSVEYGGQFESAEETTRLLTLLGLAAVLGIGLLLQVAFGSMRDALLVMVNLPLALVGGVLGVHLTGGVVTVGSLIGFITLLGIATRNGIMLVAHIRHLRDQEGVADLRSAVERGALERLAPILMTALTTGLALVPLALAGDRPGNEIQAPLAIVVLCGLLTSTALNMLVLPTLYLRVGAGPLAPRPSRRPGARRSATIPSTGLTEE